MLSDAGLLDKRALNLGKRMQRQWFWLWKHLKSYCDFNVETTSCIQPSQQTVVCLNYSLLIEACQNLGSTSFLKLILVFGFFFLVPLCKISGYCLLHLCMLGWLQLYSGRKGKCFLPLYSCKSPAKIGLWRCQHWMTLMNHGKDKLGFLGSRFDHCLESWLVTLKLITFS